MNEIDFGLVVLISTGAGYLLGKHLERKKAQAAFGNFRQHAMNSIMATTNGIMDVVHKRLPDLDVKVLMQEIVEACAKHGVQAVAVNTETGHVIKGPKPNDNAPQ
jgi:predicted metallo-beta-lactamase superfamily hydrolase